MVSWEYFVIGYATYHDNESKRKKRDKTFLYWKENEETLDF